MRFLASIACGFLAFACGASAQVVLVRDINAAGGSRSYEDLFFASEAALFFSANDGSTGGPAFWTSDGTTAGTVLVEDIFGASGFFVAPARARGVGALAWFIVNDGFTGVQPWRSDGTAAGTFAVTTPMVANDQIDTNAGFAPYVDSVAFGYAGRLWLADAAGAAQVPGPIEVSSLPVTAVDDVLQLYGKPAGAPDYGIVRTDGTTAGTALVEAVTAPFTSVAVNGMFYFTYAPMGSNNELYVLDPGAMMSRRVRDIVVGFGSSNPERLTRVDDRLFFTADDPVAGRELWVTDGTEMGTQRVEDIVMGSTGSDPRALVALNGKLYFAATTPANGTELWVSDGTEPGTRLVVDTFPGPGTGLTGAGTFGRDDAIAAVNRRIFFQGRPDNFGFGARLRLLDESETSATAFDESTLALGPMLPINGKLLFTGQRNSGGMELYGVDLLDVVGNTWCARPEKGISDDESVTASTVLLPERGALYAPRVRVDLAHASMGDLEVVLEHVETGTRVALLDPLPACDSDLVDIELADDGAAAADTGCATGNQRLAFPRDSTWRPTQPLAAFNGEAVAGRWRLEVVDGIGGGTVGTLHEWCLSWSGPDLFADGFEETF